MEPICRRTLQREHVMDYTISIERVFEHLENDQADKAVMGCLRIARHTKDYMPAAIFLREMYPNKNVFIKALYDDLQHLTMEAQKFIVEKSFEAWLETHTLPFSMDGSNDDEEDEGEKRNVIAIAVGEIDPELEQWERSIVDLAVPSGMAAFDTAAFVDRTYREKAMMRLRIRGLHMLKERIKAHCLNYAIRMERQLEAQTKSQSFLDLAQTEVNNYFRAHCDDVYAKLLRATQLVNSTNSEDAALLLTEVRRAMKSVADFFYPPVTGKVKCSDGQERLLGEEQFLNRIQEFLSSKIAKTSSRELLEAELGYLAAYFRRLSELASKGVHASVTLTEAKQGLLSLYLFLHNVCSHLDNKAPAKEEAPVAAL
jgi:hypothetical protein